MKQIYIVGGERVYTSRLGYLHLKLYNEGLTPEEMKEYKKGGRV